MNAAPPVLLSVNINKLALLRNSRGAARPDLLSFVQASLDLGVKGITVHPRPDERHIRYSDLPILSDFLTPRGIEFNIEGYPSTLFMEMVLRIRPTQVTLVPDPPGALTSSFGWDIVAHAERLATSLSTLRREGIRSSLFLDPGFGEWTHLDQLRPDRVELFTFDYAHGFPTDPNSAIAPYLLAAKHLDSLKIGINAGHDLDMHNLLFFVLSLPSIKEVSIGHALICDALSLGWAQTLRGYLQICSRS